MKARTPQDRGAALLVAITAIAVVTAVALDLAYNTRVSLQTAANARDELRATYLARSAVNMSRLVLHFQQQLDGASTAVASMQQAGAGLMANLARTGGARAAPAAGAAAPSIGVRLWDLVPVDSAAVALFLDASAGGEPRASLAAPAPANATAPAGAPAPGSVPPDGAAPPLGERRVFGGMEGSFRATIQDEDRKINLRQFDGIGAFPVAQTLRLAQLVRDPKWDFLFDEEDANGFRISRRDLFGAIKDWADQDETSTAFTADPAKPFESGFGDENAYYDRLPDRYGAKNAAFDSLDELFMVSGVSDAFMAAFGDRLTVYPDVGATINVNTDDPQQLMVNALLMSYPPGVPQPALADPTFLQKLQAALVLVRPLPFMSITPQQFAGVLQAIGVKVDVKYTQASNPGSAFGDRSSTFRIRGTGVAGAVQKNIEAVVTFDRRAEGLARDLGRLLHWHEE